MIPTRNHFPSSLAQGHVPEGGTGSAGGARRRGHGGIARLGQKGEGRAQQRRASSSAPSHLSTGLLSLHAPLRALALTMSSIPNAIHSAFSQAGKAGATGKLRPWSPHPAREQDGGAHHPSCPTCVMPSIGGIFWLSLEVVKPSFSPSHSNCVHCLCVYRGKDGQTSPGKNQVPGFPNGSQHI